MIKGRILFSADTESNCSDLKIDHNTPKILRGMSQAHKKQQMKKKSCLCDTRFINCVCLMSITVPVTEHVFPRSAAVFHCHQDSPIYCFCLTREMSTMPASDKEDGCNLKDPTTSDSHMGAHINQSDSDCPS